MIMVMINWFKLLPFSDKSSDNFFIHKGDSVWSITLGRTNKTPLGKGPMLYFGFVGDLYLFKIWMDLRFLGELQRFYKDFKNKILKYVSKKKFHISIKALFQFKC